MEAVSSTRRKIGKTPDHVGQRRAFYASPTLTAEAQSAGHVLVDVVIKTERVRELIRTAGTTGSGRAEGRSAEAAKTATEALKAVASEFLAQNFAVEIGKVVDAYRLMLRESFAKGSDLDLMSALNRARLQERILSATAMADQAQACQLLGVSGANPSATMRRKEDKREVLRFTVDGRAAYPLFQFDVEGRRVFQALSQIVAMKPGNWSDFRLLHWLTRPHLDFDGTPAAVLGTDGPAVVAAFAREIEPALHG